VTVDELAAVEDERDLPPDIDATIRALWFDRRGDWERAHQITQDIDTIDAAWVHAYLHRRQGDMSNAGYWYRRARRPEATDSLASEWKRIASALLG
jgi:hypothetical protein